MATKQELLAKAEELGLEIEEGATNAQIAEAIKAHLAKEEGDGAGGSDNEGAGPSAESNANGKVPLRTLRAPKTAGSVGVPGADGTVGHYKPDKDGLVKAKPEHVAGLRNAGFELIAE